MAESWAHTGPPSGPPLRTRCGADGEDDALRLAELHGPAGGGGCGGLRLEGDAAPVGSAHRAIDGGLKVKAKMARDPTENDAYSVAVPVGPDALESSLQFGEQEMPFDVHKGGAEGKGAEFIV